MILATPGIEYAVAFAGFSGATRANSANADAIFVGPKPFEERITHGPTADELRVTLQKRLGTITDADIFVIAPPPVRGFGTSDGFRLVVQDRAGRGERALQEATGAYVDAARAEPTSPESSPPSAPRRRSSTPTSTASSQTSSTYRSRAGSP